MCRTFCPEKSLIPGLLLAFLTAGCGGSPGDRGSPAPACGSGYIDDLGTCVPQTCGSGAWGNLEVDDSTVHVDITAGEGGDGSAGAPLRSIQPALDLAGGRGGGLVALAAGTYPETLSLTTDHAGVRLAGRCHELVLLDASVGDEETPGIDISSAQGEVELSGMRVMGSNGVGVSVGSGVVRLADLEVEGSASFGAYAYRGSFSAPTIVELRDCEVSTSRVIGLLAHDSGTEVTLVDTEIRGTQPDEGGTYGFGIQIHSAAALTADGCSIADNAPFGIWATHQGTEVVLEDSQITGTHPGSEMGYCILVQDGATIEARSCAMIDNEVEYGIRAQDPGTAVAIEELTVTGLGATDDGFADVMAFSDGADLVARSCLIRDSCAGGIIAEGLGTVVAMRDIQFLSLEAGAHDWAGAFLAALAGASLQAESCSLEQGSAGAGIVGSGVGTSVTVSDTRILGVLQTPSRDVFQAVAVEEGAAVHLESCALHDNAWGGVYATDAGTEISLEAVAISDNRTAVDGQVSPGILLSGGAHLSGESVMVDGCPLAGLWAMDEGTSFTLQGSILSGSSLTNLYGLGSGLCVIGGAQGEVSDTEFIANRGPGAMVLVGGASLHCEGCRIEGNEFAGLVVGDATVESLDSRIEDTAPSPDSGGGYGLYVLEDSETTTTVLLSDMAIRGNPMGGVWLGSDGSYQLRSSDIAGGEGDLRGGWRRCGDAVFAQEGVQAWDGSEGLLITDTTLRDANGAGLFLDSANATLAGNTYTDNDFDLVVQGEGCEAPPEGGEEAGATDICPTWDYPTCHDQPVLLLELDALQSSLRSPELPPLTLPIDDGAELQVATNILSSTGLTTE